MANLKGWQNPNTKISKPDNFGLPDTSSQSGNPQTRFLLDQLSRQMQYIVSNSAPKAKSKYGAGRSVNSSTRSSKSREQGGGGSGSGGGGDDDHHKRIATYQGKGWYFFEFRCYIHRPQCWNYTSLDTCNMADDWCCTDDWSIGNNSLREEFYAVYIDDERYFNQFMYEEHKRDVYEQYPNDPCLHWLRAVCHYFLPYAKDNRYPGVSPVPASGTAERQEYENLKTKLLNICNKYVKLQEDTHILDYGGEIIKGQCRKTKNGVTRILILRYPRAYLYGISLEVTPTLNEPYDASFVMNWFRNYW